MKVDKFSATALFCFFVSLHSAPGQSLRGFVREAATGDGLYSANVFLFEKNDSALVAATTDLTGGFQLKAPKPGIFSLKISQIGFETRIVPEIELNFGKETVLEISLKEAPGELKTVEIRPDGSDDRLPTAGLHLLTRDAVLRYPATFFDPARLAQSLPGVSNDDQNNGISVRGLSPALFQYRIEGLEVVNPNHLSNAGTISDLPTANSGGVSMLSAQVLGNSAIYTGATPIGYGNSVGGLMDIRLRPGNNEHFEGTVQAGLVGLDASVEGPISRADKSSFLVNYRYSTIGLLEKLGVQLGDEVVDFQDLSVHLKLPVNRFGEFSVFGVLGKSSNQFDGKASGQKTDKDFANIDFGQKTGIVGFSLRANWKKSWQFNCGAALSAWRASRDLDGTVDSRFSEFRAVSNRFSSMISVARRFKNRMKIEIGTEVGIERNSQQLRAYTHPGNLPGELFDLHPQKFESRNYAELVAPVGKRVTVAVGLRAVASKGGEIDSSFWAFQPRLGLDLKLNPKDHVSATVQRASQPVLTGLFPDELFKKGLDAWSMSVGLEKYFGARNKLTFGLFYQKFNQFPISYTYPAVLHSPLDWTDFLNYKKGSKLGIARLGGLEASLSRPFSNGYFCEINASLFDAKQEIRPDHFVTTRFNSRWTTNFLAGKDWQKTFETGSVRTLGINLRIHARGGFWETPIDVVKSETQQTTIFETGNENSLRLPNYFRTDLRLFWKKNRARRTGTLALDVQNTTNRLNVAWHYYDPFLDKIVAKTGLGLVPILSYRLEFQ